MDKEILISMLNKIIIYFNKELKNKVLRALKKALIKFINTLWNELKDDIREQLKIGLTKAQGYYLSEERELKEKFVLDYIMQHIELPVVLRPFKGIVRNIIKGKLEKFVHSVLFRVKVN